MNASPKQVVIVHCTTDQNERKKNMALKEVLTRPDFRVVG